MPVKEEGRDRSADKLVRSLLDNLSSPQSISGIRRSIEKVKGDLRTLSARASSLEESRRCALEDKAEALSVGDLEAYKVSFNLGTLLPSLCALPDACVLVCKCMHVSNACMVCVLPLPLPSGGAACGVSDSVCALFPIVCVCVCVCVHRCVSFVCWYACLQLQCQVVGHMWCVC